MSTFILTWNPAIDEYKTSQFVSDMLTINDGDSVDLYWPLTDYKHGAEGDRFFMLRTGRGHNGICMAGYFNSDPFQDDEYTGPGKQYCVSIDPLVLVNPEEAEFVSLDELSALLPSIDWKHLESGTIISDEEAGVLEEHWLNYLYAHQQHYNGVQAAKSWNFDLEDFESIPETLQDVYLDKYGDKCEKCGRTEDQVDELAYHLVIDDAPHTTPLRQLLHCYCNECWFGQDED